MGVPHTPVYPKLAAQETESGHDLSTRYGAVADVVAGTDPDVLVLLTCDHINTFFLDAWPTLAVVVRESLTGPNDDVPTLGRTTITLSVNVAQSLHNGLIDQDFDPTLSAPNTVDHSVVVPLHFLNPQGIPVVLIYLNGMVPPLPSARRCLALGAAIQATLADLPVRRAAVIASGSFSLDVGGPKTDPELGYGIPDPTWAAEVAGLLRQGDITGLAEAATTTRIATAGTVAGELLPWLTMAATATNLESVTVDYRPGEGHAFGSWW